MKARATEASVRDFLASITDDARREECLRALEIMRRATGAEPKLWGKGMVGFGNYHYRYDSDREGDCFLTGFSPRKDNLTRTGEPALPAVVAEGSGQPAVHTERHALAQRVVKGGVGWVEDIVSVSSTTASTRRPSFSPWRRAIARRWRSAFQHPCEHGDGCHRPDPENERPFHQVGLHVSQPRVERLEALVYAVEPGINRLKPCLHLTSEFGEFGANLRALFGVLRPHLVQDHTEIVRGIRAECIAQGAGESGSCHGWSG
jgi:hypothetical protein